MSSDLGISAKAEEWLIIIRRAVETDLIDIMTIYNDAILKTTATYDYCEHSLEDRKRWFDNKIESGYPVFVFEENGRVLGFSTYGPFRSRPAYKYTIENSVYVGAGHRGRGIGTSLLQELIQYASEREFATMVAGIDAENESSIKVHEKLGFQYAGTIKRAGYKFGRWLDLTFYQLSLVGPANPTED